MKSVGLFTLDFVLQGHKLLKYMGTIGNPLYSKNRLFSNINFDFAPTHFMNSAWKKPYLGADEGVSFAILPVIKNLWFCVYSTFDLFILTVHSY